MERMTTLGDQTSFLTLSGRILNKGKFPNDMEVNTTKSCNAIHLRSEKELKQTLPSDKKKEREEKVGDEVATQDRRHGVEKETKKENNKKAILPKPSCEVQLPFP